MKKKKTRSIVIVGRRWFERTNGNTYHTAEIYVNGRLMHKIPFNYGYGNQYSWTAAQWLEENGYLPRRDTYAHGSGESLYRYTSRNGIELVDTVTDVSRKGDL